MRYWAHSRRALTGCVPLRHVERRHAACSKTNELPIRRAPSVAGQIRKAAVVMHREQRGWPSRLPPSRLRASVRIAAWLSAVGFWLSGCVSQLQCDGPTGPCVATGGPNEAAVTAAFAGAAWVVGGGCAIAGCRPPYVCNAETGLCEQMACGEGRGTCPAGWRCNYDTSSCE
jgi:hypothetical protein